MATVDTITLRLKTGTTITVHEVDHESYSIGAYQPSLTAAEARELDFIMEPLMSVLDS